MEEWGSCYLSLWPESPHSILVERKWKIDLTSSTSAASALPINWLSICFHSVGGLASLHLLPLRHTHWVCSFNPSKWSVIEKKTSYQHFYPLTIDLFIPFPFFLIDLDLATKNILWHNIVFKAKQTEILFASCRKLFSSGNISWSASHLYSGTCPPRLMLLSWQINSITRFSLSGL